MDLLGEVKKRADANGDGKLSIDDLNSLKEQYPDQAGLLDKAKEIADQNGDGKVDLSDIKNFNLGDVAGQLGSLFGKK